MLRRFLVALPVLALLCVAAAGAQSTPLTLDQVFGVNPPWGSQPSRITWAPDGNSFLYVLPTQDPFQAGPVHVYDVRAKNDRILIDPHNYGKGAGTPGSLVWSPDSRSLAFTIGGTLYVRNVTTGRDRAIDRRASDPQWSPRGGAIAYVKAADLYVATLAPSLLVRRLTKGGKEDRILNGGLDWVYPEELGTSHGFAWAPDGKSIAYMRMDERPVTDFPLVDFMPVDNVVANEKYPLAGENNPKVTLRVVSLASGADSLVYDAANADDEYLPFIAWQPNSPNLVYEVLDRGQKRLRVVLRTFNLHAAEILYNQADDKWVDDVPLPVWLSGGRSLWMLDRDGTNGLYLRDTSGNLKRLTGAYRSDSLLGVDGLGTSAYVTAAYPTRRDRSLIAVSLNVEAGVPGNSGVTNLTPAPGAHNVSLAPGGAFFVDTHSTLNDPPQTDLVNAADLTVAGVFAPRNETLRSQLLPVEMFSVPSRYGALDATMIKPPGFDAGHKYPVIVYVYGGPAAPTTANTFGDQRALYHQLLAQNGFIVFSIDGPASQVDSDANVRLLYHNFGPGSLMGQEIGARYLQSLAYVDPSRIGIWGWSFGGYETAYAMTHSTLFKAGAAVAPVTDWHYYDTIYTERYMGKPQENLAAYNASSVLPAAANLHGDLLISHGTSDDNVHMANTVSLLQSFIDAGETNVDFMVYPRRTHSIAGIAQRRHLYGHMLQWWLKHL
ncbi:MAG TPA: DPP IV N-terminal domain-containing protein [Candidatus Rubrimentiphilum sp.]|nr:DPP IV N-terminal domain-containing protein [Candidatus Rubrimentiphilum sp.]